MPNDPKRRFLRVYFDDLERDYPDVWFDPTCLSTFVRLLALAEKAWPSAPELPRAIRRADLALLQKPKAPGEDPLVTLLDHGLFAMKGWQELRQERAEKARESVSHRNDRSTTVDRTYNDGSSRVSSSRASSSFSSSSSSGESPERGSEFYPSGDRDALDLYHELTGYKPWGIWSGDKLRGAITEYGNDVLEEALRSEAKVDLTRDTLMDRTFVRLARDAERIKREKAKKPKPPKPDAQARYVELQAIQAGLREVVP